MSRASPSLPALIPFSSGSAPRRAPLQLASGEPPRVNVASFRLLFMIVRDDPPQLEGSQWSTDFKDFVWQCLRKVRPPDALAAAGLGSHASASARPVWSCLHGPSQPATCLRSRPP